MKELIATLNTKSKKERRVMAEKEEVQSVGECTLNKMQAVVYLVCDLSRACLQKPHLSTNTRSTP